MSKLEEGKQNLATCFLNDEGTFQIVYCNSACDCRAARKELWCKF